MTQLPLTNLEGILPFREGQRHLLPLIDLPGQAKVVVVALSVGVTIPPHAMHCEAVLLVLSGTIEFMIGETWRRVETGQFLGIPAGANHSVRAVEASRFLVMQSFVGAPGKAH